jgi:aspartate 1-decarboxylase
MILQILKSKIKELTVTESNVNYPGSISLPDEILKASGIRQFELVHVNNKTNGNRITTYAVRGKVRGRVTVNGAASKLFEKGDTIHVLAFMYLNESEMGSFEPSIVIADKENNLIESRPYVII